MPHPLLVLRGERLEDCRAFGVLVDIRWDGLDLFAEPICF